MAKLPLDVVVVKRTAAVCAYAVRVGVRATNALALHSAPVAAMPSRGTAVGSTWRRGRAVFREFL